MKITLEAGRFGWDYIIRAADGRSLLVQTDYDYPSVATVFGFYLGTVQLAQSDYDDVPTNFGRPTRERNPALDDCAHSGTDGTVACIHCGVTASMFIDAANEYLTQNDGVTVDDPGFFDAE